MNEQYFDASVIHYETKEISEIFSKSVVSLIHLLNYGSYYDMRSLKYVH